MNVLITANVDSDALGRFEHDLEMNVTYRPIGDREARFPPVETKELIEDVDVFVVGYEEVSADIMAAADSLRLIGCPRGGPDANIDIAAATERNIPVVYAPGRNAISVADMTLGLILGVVRHIPRAHRLLHDGVYTGNPQSNASGEREDVTWGVAKNTPYMDLKGPELDGTVLGIVGLGAIGRLVAERASGFGMEIVAADPFIDAETMAERDVEKVELDGLLARSDVVTVHSPVTDETRGMIGEAEFGRMKESAYFINTARAALTDQLALVRELEAGGLRGAALDVYDDEPLPENHPLFDLPNVVTTPHIAGAAEEVPGRGAKLVTDGIEAVLNGNEPEHIANPETIPLVEMNDEC